MSRLSSTALLLILFVTAPTIVSAQKPQKRAKKTQKAVVQQPAPPVTPPQSQPEPPATPEHGPSSPPDVMFKGGQLTITARNSTLGDVLNAVKQKTGASVDMPAASGERVVGQFGPGAPRDVMAQLLNGSHYDYVLMGSPSDPGALNKIVLMARANGPEPNGNAQQAQTPGQPGLQAVPQVQTDQGDDNAVEVPPDVPQPEEQEQPEQPDQAEQPDQPPPAGQSGPTVKTPEELLRELQQQQQQQQQQNGQTPQQERQ